MVEEDQQIRAAAESLLSGSLRSQRTSFTQHSVNRTPEIVLSEDLIAGAMHQGRMSNVRRFFCLFVTFDLLFTCLMWLICTMLAGDNIETAFKKQVIHYHIQTSLFDIVMVAVCRFTVLLLFYALLYMNHWIIIALSTATTCAFLIAKVFLFNWSQTNQPGFQVLLVISSFVLAWGEAWFFDFRVIPQETQARDWIIGSSESERAPLLRQFLAGPLSQHTESVGNFYSPMDSPEHSDTETDDRVKQDDEKISDQLGTPILPKLSPEKKEEYLRKGKDCLDRCRDLLLSPNWKVESHTSNGDIVSYMNLPKPDGRIMKITGVIDIAARELLVDLLENVEDYPMWNKHVSESRKIQKVDEQTDIVYQATVAHGGGMVGARDFIVLRHWGERGSTLISSGVSIPYAPVPPRKNFVRGENGVGCWAMEPLLGEEDSKCRFTWIMNTNLKGWLPQRVIEASLSTALTEFMDYLRNHIHAMKN